VFAALRLSCPTGLVNPRQPKKHQNFFGASRRSIRILRRQPKKHQNFSRPGRRAWRAESRELPGRQLPDFFLETVGSGGGSGGFSCFALVP